MKYTNVQIESILEKLRNMPPVESVNQNCSKQEAIKILKEEIASMQQRGYTLDKISSILNEEGLEIGTTTLKNYLQRAKIKNEKIANAANKIKKSELPELKTEEKSSADLVLSRKPFVGEI